MNKVLIIFCGLFALAIANKIPTRHYGICYVDGQFGQCQHRHKCWENDNDLTYLNRSQCASQKRVDLVCCRRWSPPMLPNTSVCGRISNRANYRVINGALTNIQDYPWMALLRYTSDGMEYAHLCGGSLIHARWVLTAAHCVVMPTDLREVKEVRLGEWNITSSPDCQHLRNEVICAPPHIDIKIDRIIVHEQYVHDQVNVPHDIALLRLEREVNFSQFVMPICLPSANTREEHAYADVSMDVAGWGRTENSQYGGSSMKLMAMLRVMSVAECGGIYAKLGPGQFCAGNSSTRTCHGDSGGPLMMLKNGSYYLAGIVSLGSSNCRARQITIFTKVEHYIPWIMQTLNANALT